MALGNAAIAAIATAPGRAAVGVVRVSGPATVVAALARTIATSLPAPRRAMLRRLRAANGEAIDTGLVIHFPGPLSYTGEDVLEFHVHGSPPVLQCLLQACLDAGARPARPGEFTERAWFNGRMDLLQAEAVADLIEARSQQAAQLAQRALGGAASRALTQLESQLGSLRARLEASIDFADETADAEGDEALVDGLDHLAAAARSLLGGVERGRRQRAGLQVVIVGPPNAGKSSLFNRLLRMERALVSAEPGTTRDTIDAELALGAVSVRLCDTAGVRDTATALEAEGVRRTRQQLAEADVWLFVSAPDVAAASRVLLDELMAIKPDGVRLVWVTNKADVPGSGAPAKHRQGVGQPSVGAVTDERPVVHTPASPPPACEDMASFAVSARTGLGLDALEEYLQELAGGLDADGIGLTGERHARALAAVAACVEESLALLDSGAGPELAAEALRQAGQEFDALFGRHADTEALLGEIFSRFCIGK